MVVGMIWHYPHFVDTETDDQKGLKRRKKGTKEAKGKQGGKMGRIT